MDIENLCMGCMQDKGSEPVCPRCQYDESKTRPPLFLPHRVILDNKYVIGRALGDPGGFGITYLGWDINLAMPVAIKEFLPRDLAGRHADGMTIYPHSEKEREIFDYGLKQFVKEARTLAKFNHPNVVRVRTFFQENSTAYLVMDYYDGISLAEYIEDNGGKIKEKLAVNIMMPILDGLRQVHDKGFLHRDIKPQNIYLTEGRMPILLDFGAARFAMGERSRSLSVMLTPGFSPFEQYQEKGKQGAWTDIYACAATLYFMITGKKPQAASDRVTDDELIEPKALEKGISAKTNKAIMKALSMKINQRPQSVKQFQDLLIVKKRPEPQPEHTKPRPEPPTPPPDTQKKRKRFNDRTATSSKNLKLAIIFGIIIIVLIGFILVFVFDAQREAKYKQHYNIARQNFQTGNFESMIGNIEQAKQIKETDELKTLETKYTKYKIHFDRAKEEFHKGNIKSMFEHIEQAKQVKETRELQALESHVPQHIMNIFDKAKEIGKNSQGLWEAVFDDDIEMVYIPPGEFMMGSPESETSRYENEGPQNKVKISKGFWMGKYEVTIGQYLKFCKGEGSNYPVWLESGSKYNIRTGSDKMYVDFVSEDFGDKRPVVGVSWNDVSAYCQWLSAKTGLFFRLPTEAEWEYACRAGTTTPFHYGESLSSRQANFDGNGPYGNAPKGIYREKTLSVGSFEPNPWGLYDMHSNVYEWCNDWYEDDYYSKRLSIDPRGPSNGTQKILRGGSWASYAWWCRSAFRFYAFTTGRGNYIGFRHAMETDKYNQTKEFTKRRRRNLPKVRKGR